MSTFGSKSVKLTYFGIEGAAEKVRLAMKMAGIPFEDVRIAFQDWPAMKPNMPNQQLPILEIDGSEPITQSAAMAKWAARQHPTLYSGDADRLLVIDQMIHILDDDVREFQPALYMGMRPAKFGRADDFAKTEEGAALVKSMRSNYVENDLPKAIKLLTAQLKKSGGPFLLGAEITLADLFWLPRLRYLQSGICDHVPTDCLDYFPEILAYKQALMGDPTIAKHYTK